MKPDGAQGTECGNWGPALCSFPLQIVSQKDEHCWVGELNGLRGEVLVPIWGQRAGL